MTSKTLPFHADTVGSYLRSQPLKEARAKFAAGELSREQLTEVEDQEIAKSVQDKAMEAAKAVGEKSIEMLRMKKAELQAQFDELSSSITNHTVFGQGRIIKAFPEMKHRDYFELIQELKKKLK